MPAPLSCTVILTRSLLAWLTATVTFRSPRARSAVACFALRTRFTRICSTLCLSTRTGGASAKSRVIAMPWRSNEASIICSASSTRATGGSVSTMPETFEKFCCTATMSLMWPMFLVSPSTSFSISACSTPTRSTTLRMNFGSDFPFASLVRKAARVLLVLLQQRRDAGEMRDLRFPQAIRDEHRGDVHAVEHVADIVQHAGRDLRHAGLAGGGEQLLVRATQLFFVALARGHVLRGADHAHGAALRIEQHVAALGAACARRRRGRRSFARN